MKIPKMIKIRITDMHNNDYKKEFYAFKYYPNVYICWHDEDEYPHFVDIDLCEEVPMNIIEEVNILPESDRKIPFPKAIDENKIFFTEQFNGENYLNKLKCKLGVKKITVEF